MARNRKNNFYKVVKDYSVAIIWFILILLLIFSVFWWDDSSQVDQNLENKDWIQISMDSDSEAYIEYPQWNREKVDANVLLYKWEKIIVKKWDVFLKFPLNWDFRLNELWELTYEEDSSFSLDSSDLFINASSNTSLKMRYANLDILEGTVLSLNQNEMSSSIYVLKWVVEVSNMSWKKTVLWNAQKIVITRTDFANEEVDLSLLREDIDDIFKGSDWFIKNNWEFYLTSLNSDENASSTWSYVSSSSSLFSLRGVSDEQSFSDNLLDLQWALFIDDISKITVNWKEADLDTENKSFSISLDLENSVNDFVFKVYDSDDNLIWKYVYSFYYSWSSYSNNTAWSFKVTNFKVDASNFKFTEPSSTWTFTTYDDFVTIRWLVSSEWISSVSVNDYTLSSFNGTTWRYHASSANNNLIEWTNIYEVKYFWSDWKLLYTNYYTIIKKTASSWSNNSNNQEESLEEKPSSTISWEASVN